MASREIQLDIGNRLRLLGMLPREGDFLTLKVLRELKEALALSEEEKQRVGLMEIPGGMIRWDTKREKEQSLKYIVLFDTMESIIVKTLKDLDSKKKLTEDQLELYEYFLLAKEK